MPRVSVVMPAFNAANYLRQAIRSVVAQSERDWELIVVDDGSTDQTCAIVKKHADEDNRIKLLRLAARRGPGHARNRGVAAAVGRWITFLDADDWYHPQRLESLVETAERNDASVIADNQLFVLEGQTHPWRALVSDNQHSVAWLTLSDVLRESRFGRLFNIGLVKPMIKKSLIDAHSISYKEDVRLGEEYLMLITICQRAREILFVSTPYYYYIIRKDSLSRTSSLEDLAAFRAALDPMLAEMRCTEVANAPELDDLRSDIDGYLQCHIVEHKLRRAQLLDAVLAIMSQPSMTTRLFHLLCLKVSREIAFMWQQNPPQLITCLHELRLRSHARQRTFD